MLKVFIYHIILEKNGVITDYSIGNNNECFLTTISSDSEKKKKLIITGINKKVFNIHFNIYLKWKHLSKSKNILQYCSFLLKKCHYGDSNIIIFLNIFFRNVTNFTDHKFLYIMLG